MMKKNSEFPRMHVSLYVSDIETTTQFYDIFFSQPAHKIEVGYAKYILEKPSLIISFIENAELVKSQFGHLGFQVDSKETLEERLGQLQEKGLVVKEEMGTACCYALQDKFWVNDPDGYAWEVYHFHKDVAFNDPHYTKEGEADVCCIPTGKVKVNLKEVKQESCCEPESGCC